MVSPNFALKHLWTCEKAAKEILLIMEEVGAAWGNKAVGRGLSDEEKCSTELQSNDVRPFHFLGVDSFFTFCRYVLIL